MVARAVTAAAKAIAKRKAIAKNKEKAAAKKKAAETTVKKPDLMDFLGHMAFMEAGAAHKLRSY